jgi:phosphoribosyl-dephospho-CoA transferase
VTVSVHTLLRIAGAGDLEAPGAPGWVAESLARAPWVVVRRERASLTRIPVGVRGATRDQRFAAWLATGAVREQVRPVELVVRRAWAHHARAHLPAVAVLDRVAALMERAGLSGEWGPCGSVGFELTSGCPTVRAESDLDVCVESGQVFPREVAGALSTALAQLRVRIDVLIETPAGALALSEYAHGRSPFLVRGVDGARRSVDPWARAAAA